SSRRRHTSIDCDWSSDVCSSDLEIDLETVTGTDDVVGADRKIHRDRLRVICSVAKDLHSKTLIGPLMRRGLHIHVVKRWDIRIRSEERRVGKSDAHWCGCVC